jgi:hypothetical protein
MSTNYTTVTVAAAKAAADNRVTGTGLHTSKIVGHWNIENIESKKKFCEGKEGLS